MQKDLLGIRISIHAPTRGATRLFKIFIRFPEISIHAPTRGATLYVFQEIRQDFYFNPRSHKGSDWNGISGAAGWLKFQSTLPQGERPATPDKDGNTHYISIHAPTRGATVCLFFISFRCPHFNPRSHKGSDTHVTH